MLKTALYGLLRVTFDLLGSPAWWWGLIPLAVGLFTAIYGVVFAAAQTDMKRLLAFSSIENIGIIFTGVGLAIVFRGVGMTSLAALALIAVLYHAVNHAFMKSLLFLGTGSVLHATGQRNLGRLGGLIHRMPWVAWLTLIGVLAIAGLPPLNGFVSEWLLLQAFLSAHEVPQTFVNMLLPLGAAVIALAAALAAYVMVKFYRRGVPRAAARSGARRCSRRRLVRTRRSRMAGVRLRRARSAALAGGGAARASCPRSSASRPRYRSSSWWHFVPLPTREAAYAPLVFLLAISRDDRHHPVGGDCLYHRRVRRGPPWDCGFARLDARMQDTAEGFGQPIRHIFGPFFDMRRELPTPFDRAPRYHVVVGDELWRLLY